MYFSANRFKCGDRIQLKTIVTHVIRVLKIYQECELIQHTIEIVQRASSSTNKEEYAKFELFTV